MAKTILSGIVAGVALFVWGFLAHTVLPLGTMGMSTHPHESMLLPAIQQTTTIRGSSRNSPPGPSGTTR
jgi:hypothetical protein